jgi:hypothetical protein
MRRLLALTICVGLALSFLPSSQAAPQSKLVVDCGSFGFEEDEKGSYRALNSVATYSFYGYKFSYTVYFATKKGPASNKQTRQVGSVKLSPARKAFRTEVVPFESKYYLNDVVFADYYNAKYFQAVFVFIDQTGIKSNFTCIWKK